MRKKLEWNTVLRLLAVLGGAFVALVCIFISFNLHFNGNIPARNFAAFEGSFIWIFIGYFVISLLLETYVLYNQSLMDIFYNTMLAQFILSIYLMALIYIGSWLEFPRSVVLTNFFIGTLGLYAYNYLVYRFYHHYMGQKTVMVVGEDQRALEAVRNFDYMTNRHHQVTHVVMSDYFHHIQQLNDEVDIVYLTGRIAEEERIEIYKYLMHRNKKLFVSTNFENIMMVNPNIMNFEDESIIEVSNFEIPADQALIKRFLDIVVSLLMLIVTAPIMLITAIAIKIDSPGPVLYKQERITLNQRPFQILKFRSMSQDAEAKSGPKLASSNDSRVTRVGKFIRSTRIDELPQLFNVLKGDMSLVGPRPERPYFVDQYQELNPYYSLRHHVRAGITGYAQVYGKYSTDFNNKLNFDLIYIKNYSLGFDLRLLFQTIKILFDKVSARGVEEEDLELKTWEDFEREMKIIY